MAITDILLNIRKGGTLVDEYVRNIILNELKELEKKENIKILFAVESGAEHGALNLKTAIMMFVLYT